MLCAMRPHASSCYMIGQSASWHTLGPRDHRRESASLFIKASSTWKPSEVVLRLIEWRFLYLIGLGFVATKRARSNETPFRVGCDRCRFVGML